MIEPKMTFYAAVRRTKENLKVLLKSINRMKQNLDSPETFSKANLTFHLEVAKAAPNPFLYSFYQNAIAMLDDTARLVQSVPGQSDLTIHFHTQIYKAILGKKPQESEMLMNAHLSQIENDMRIARDLRRRPKRGEVNSRFSAYQSKKEDRTMKTRVFLVLLISTGLVIGLVSPGLAQDK